MTALQTSPTRWLTAFLHRVRTDSPVRNSRWLTAILHRVRTDSLVRNSLYLMASTIVTAGMGYLFWLVAAHMLTRQEVGIGSAVISLCSTVSLLTFLGPAATLIEQLPARERSSRWTILLTRMCVATALATVAAMIAVLPLLLGSRDYRTFFSTAAAVALALGGAAAWTVINLLAYAFVSARRAGGFLLSQTLISAVKIVLILPLAAGGAGAVGLVGAWGVSAGLGAAVGAIWLVPRMRLGRQPRHRPRRLTRSSPAIPPRAPADPRHRQLSARPGGVSVRRLLGQHLTSIGGAVTPLAMPALVAFRLGATQNAYFYIAWMMGGAFFMVSPAVATALFAEGVRKGADLRTVVAKALRVIAAILIPAMAVMITGGKLVLGLFGAEYAATGYGLLVLLALSALPDAISNVAVAVCRVTHRLGYSSVLNLSMFAGTLAGAWLLMPPLGIVGVGVAWLAVQILGAIASLPVYARLREVVIA
jgi:O-antigen/teichoic acid export membrane protein